MKTAPKRPLTEVERVLVHTVMFNAGILPMESSTLDMRRALQQLPAEEAKALKRKFRKLWRKAARSKAPKPVPTKPDQKINLDPRLGVGKRVASRRERNERKKLVCDVFWEEAIGPMMEKFENPGGKKLPPKK